MKQYQIFLTYTFAERKVKDRSDEPMVQIGRVLHGGSTYG